MCLGSSEKELTILLRRNLDEKCLRNHCPQFLCIILIITGKYCPGEQGAVLNLDSSL